MMYPFSSSFNCSTKASSKGNIIVFILLCLFFLLSMSNVIRFKQITQPCRALATCLRAENAGTDETQPDHQRLGAYYQTSTSHLHATEIVLAIFRRSYPTALLTVYIDNDDRNRVDWDALQPINLLPSYYYNASVRSATPNNGMYFGTVDACVAYVHRLIEAARQEMVDWLILLEDDVWVCSRINTSLLVYDMNGQCIAKYSSAWSNPAPGSCYGGCGGFVLRGSFLRDIIMRVDTRRYIHEILLTIGRPVASDELLSALFLRSNGTIGKIADYAEEMTWNPPSSPVIVHQMKHFYHSRPDCNEW